MVEGKGGGRRWEEAEENGRMREGRESNSRKVLWELGAKLGVSARDGMLGDQISPLFNLN